MIEFKTVYLYRESDFPEKGWIHPCFTCYAPTGNLVHYKTKERIERVSSIYRHFLTTKRVKYEYIVYMCRSCNKKIQVNDELKSKYVSRCERYIRSIHR